MEPAVRDQILIRILCEIVCEDKPSPTFLDYLYLRRLGMTFPKYLMAITTLNATITAAKQSMML
jgi:hypothetical protein